MILARNAACCRLQPLLPAVVLLLTSLLASCHGHSFLLSPLSRARVLGYGEYDASAGNGLGKSPFRTYPDGTFINDQSDVCGDPHQDNGDLSLRSRVTATQVTYAAGSTISVTFRARVNHGGWVGIKICPSTRSNPSQSCFDQYALTNADTGYKRWWIQSGVYRTDGVNQDYVIRWRLPAGVTCDGGCVMQMTYRTANSCVDSCSAAECGASYAARNNPITRQTNLAACGRTEIFKDCADIKITTSGGGDSVGGSPSPTSGGSSPTTCGASPSAFCSGRTPGYYGDKCASCSKYYWCYGSGAVYTQCAPGTTMDSRGTKSYCDYPANNVC